jgi:hypothetical protein
MKEKKAVPLQPNFKQCKIHDEETYSIILGPGLGLADMRSKSAGRRA